MDSLNTSGAVFEKQIESLLKDCSNDELRLIVTTIEAIKDALRDHDRRNRHCE
jgi:hypothetical protein